jgi:hypothetical protein
MTCSPHLLRSKTITVSLTDAEGRPVSAFGSNSQWSQGAVTNAASFSSNSDLFGANLNRGLSTTPAPFSATKAGSTSLGFVNPAKNNAPGAHGAMMNPVAPSTETGSSGTPTAKNIKGDASPFGMAAKAGAKKLSPDNETPDDEEQEPSSPYPVLAGQAAGQAVKLGARVMGRNGSMWQGATEARTSSPMPGGMSLGEDAEEA